MLKKSTQNCIIDWVVEEKFKGVLEHNSDINNIHSVNLSKVKQKKSLLLLIRVLKKVRHFGVYDKVIDAQGLLKSAIIAKLLQSKVIYGFDKKSIRESWASFFYQKKITISYNENTIRRNIDVICNPLNISVSDADILAKKKFLFFTNSFIPKQKEYIIFIVNSTWESKNYPMEKFVEIADALKITCFITWCNKAEKQKAIIMCQKSNYIYSLPKLNTNDLKSVISNAKLLIGNDTGPSHMAWALNVAAITIFGPTPISRIYQTPYNKAIASTSKIIHRKLNKQDFSIRDIVATDIIHIAKQLLQK